jgi:hypothetical protein
MNKLTLSMPTATQCARSYRFGRLPFLVLLFSLLGLVQPGLAHTLEISARELPALTGQRMGTFGFYAVQNGSLEPIAHQWIRWSQEDTPYFKEDDELHPSGNTDTINPRDRLMLRFEDGGPQMATSQMVTKPLAEVAITYNNQRRYFYVVKNPYRYNTKTLVTFDTDKMVIKTTHYALFMNKDNMLIWKDFFYKGYESLNGQPQSILDTMKLRLSAGIFSKHTRVTLTNDNLQPHIKQIIRGPLATLVYSDTSLKVAGIKVLSIHNYFVIQPNQTDIYARFTLPSAAKVVLNSPSVAISLDGNALYGSRLITSWTGNRVAVTDGRVSPVEKEMTDTPMPLNGWLFFDTGNHFNLLAQLQFGNNLSVPVSLIYQDNAAQENKPERFPGQQPNVGFSMQDLPFGQLFSFMVELIYNGDPVSDGVAYAHTILSPPLVNYRALTN